MITINDVAFDKSLIVYRTDDSIDMTKTVNNIKKEYNDFNAVCMMPTMGSVDLVRTAIIFFRFENVEEIGELILLSDVYELMKEDGLLNRVELTVRYMPESDDFTVYDNIFNIINSLSFDSVYYYDKYVNVGGNAYSISSLDEIYEFIVDATNMEPSLVAITEEDSNVWVELPRAYESDDPVKFVKWHVNANTNEGDFIDKPKKFKQLISNDEECVLIVTRKLYKGATIKAMAENLKKKGAKHICLYVSYLTTNDVVFDSSCGIEYVFVGTYNKNAQSVIDDGVLNDIAVELMGIGEGC